MVTNQNHLYQRPSSFNLFQPDPIQRPLLNFYHITRSQMVLRYFGIKMENKNNILSDNQCLLQH